MILTTTFYEAVTLCQFIRGTFDSYWQRYFKAYLKSIQNLWGVVLQAEKATLQFNPLSANFTKWSNTLKQFVGKLPTNCLSVFDHFVGLALKGLRKRPILNLARIQSTYYGTNAIHFKGSLIWNNLPAKVKFSNSVFEFKTKIRNLGNFDCGCLICM